MCDFTTDAGQTQVNDTQRQFYQDLADQDRTAFADDQGLFHAVTNAYMPILEKGPDQYGFTDAEQNDRTSAAIEGNAKNFAAAHRAMADRTAAAGGGDTLLPSGTEAVAESNLASDAAASLSDEQRQIRSEGYALGRQKFNAATSALLGARTNPNAYAAAANTAGSDAFDSSTTLAKQRAADSSWIGPLIGAGVGMVTKAATAGVA